MVEQFRRTDPRYPRQLDVEITISGRVVTGKTRNLSLGGMFVETAEALAMQSTVTLRFRVSTQPEPVEVTGEVRWSEKPNAEGLAGAGIRFHGLRARDVWALNRFFIV